LLNPGISHEPGGNQQRVDTDMVNFHISYGRNAAKSERNNGWPATKEVAILGLYEVISTAMLADGGTMRGVVQAWFADETVQKTRYVSDYLVWRGRTDPDMLQAKREVIAQRLEYISDRVHQARRLALTRHLAAIPTIQTWRTNTAKQIVEEYVNYAKPPVKKNSTDKKPLDAMETSTPDQFQTV